MYSTYFKRPIDIVLATIGLVLFMPVFVLVSFLILVSDGFPILFMQQRIGLNGKKFRICKFRTMSVAGNKDQSGFDVGQSSRVTGIGRWLRRSKLDEMPQLLNVLFGQMSIIGPRPEVEHWTQVYDDQWARVHSVRPGITDWSAIKFRNEESILAASADPEMAYREEVLPKKLALYSDYVANVSFKNDVKILFSTIRIIFS